MSSLWEKIKSFSEGDLTAIEPVRRDNTDTGRYRHPEYLKPIPTQNMGEINYIKPNKVAQQNSSRKPVQQYKRPEIPNYVTPIGKGAMQQQEQEQNQNLTPAQQYVAKAQGKYKDTLTYWGVGRKIEDRYSPNWWSIEDAYKRGANISRYNDLIDKYAKQYGVDPYLIKGMMITESRGNPNAKSPAGALGLMQIMPTTAKEWGVTDRTNPEQAIKFAAQYMDYLIKYWQKRGYKDRELATDFAIASYNWGMGSVGQYFDGKREINEEAKNYLPQVKWHMQIAREAGV